MRKIKFRAWDEALKKMDYSRLNAITFDGRIFYGNADFTDYKYIIMQYTGLKDRNDVEIFEGDIVKTASGDIQEVGYYHEGFEGGSFIGFMCKSKKKLDFMAMSSKDEVIGNIHENPELLKVPQ